MAGRSRRRRRVAVPVAVAALIALGGCGGGGSGGGDSGKSSKPGTPAQERATAEKINLRMTDFPKGWTSTPHQAGAAGADSLRQFLVCLGIPDPATRYRTDVHSPDFSQGQTTSASSEVLMASTDADASSDLAAFQSAKGPECFKQTLQKLLPGRLPEGAPVPEVTARQLDFPTLKDGTAAYQASLTLDAGGGLNVPVYVDLIIFRAGRAEVAMNALNTGSPLDPALEKDLAKKMADRA